MLWGFSRQLDSPGYKRESAVFELPPEVGRGRSRTNCLVEGVLVSRCGDGHMAAFIRCPTSRRWVGVISAAGYVHTNLLDGEPRAGVLGQRQLFQARPVRVHRDVAEYLHSLEGLAAGRFLNRRTLSFAKR